MSPQRESGPMTQATIVDSHCHLDFPDFDAERPDLQGLELESRHARHPTALFQPMEKKFAAVATGYSLAALAKKYIALQGTQLALDPVTALFPRIPFGGKSAFPKQLLPVAAGAGPSSQGVGAVPGR